MTPSFRVFMLIIAFSFFRCGPPVFEADTRVLIKGILQTEDGQGLSNREIGVYTQRGSGILFSFGNSQNDYLLGRGYSDNNGSFSITSLYDRDDDFYIGINGEEIYSNYIYATSTRNYTPSNLTFNLGIITLRKLATINYQITRTSPVGTTLTYSFTIEDTNCVEHFENGILDPNLSSCFDTFGIFGTLNDDMPDISSSKKTNLASTVIFQYSINGEPEITETFIVNQENYDFSFSY